MLKKKNNKEADYSKTQTRRILITGTLLALALALTLYFRFVLEIGVVYTHFFYIPIIIVSIWWGYWGILVAAGFGIMLFVFNVYAGFQNYTEDFFRSFLFIAVSYLAGLVSNAEKRISHRLIETEKISKIRESIISLLTHQILTPLTAIRWQIELLVKSGIESTEKEKEEYLEQIYNSTKKAIDLIESFVHLNKIESGKIEYSPVPTDLIALINQVILEMEDTRKEKQQKIYFKKDGLIEANIDPVIVSQIVYNLLSNAIKYTPDRGEIKISVEILNKEMFFKISDNGCGIPKEEHKKVFSRFFRGSNITQAVFEGTGLGLSIVKGLVDFCGGKVWFESEKDKGATFYFTLPI